MIQWTLFYSFLCISRSYFILILTWVRQFNKLQSDNEGILQWLSCWAMKLCREGQILAIQFLPFWSLLHKTQVRKFKCLKSIDCLFSENTKIEILVKIHRRTFHLLTRHFLLMQNWSLLKGFCLHYLISLWSLQSTWSCWVLYLIRFRAQDTCRLL